MRLIFSSLIIFFYSFSQAQCDGDITKLGKAIVKALKKADEEALLEQFSSKEVFTQEYGTYVDESSLEYDTYLVPYFKNNAASVIQEISEDGVNLSKIKFKQIEEGTGDFTTYNLYFTYMDLDYRLELIDCVCFDKRWSVIGYMSYYGQSKTFSDEEMQPYVDEFCACGNEALYNNDAWSMVEACWVAEFETEDEMWNLDHPLYSPKFDKMVEDQCADVYVLYYEVFFGGDYEYDYYPYGYNDQYYGYGDYGYGDYYDYDPYADSWYEVDTELGVEFGEILKQGLEGGKQNSLDPIYISKEDMGIVLDEMNSWDPEGEQEDIEEFWPVIEEGKLQDMEDIWNYTNELSINWKKASVTKVSSMEQTYENLTFVDGSVYLESEGTIYRIWFSGALNSAGNYRAVQVRWLGADF